MLKIIWMLSNGLLRLTHRRRLKVSRQGSTVGLVGHLMATATGWEPRRWARLLRLEGHPWLWCSCGDALETYFEVRTGRCWVCQVGKKESE